MKENYDISKQLQDDLVKAYNKVAPLSWTQEDAYKKAVKQPAPRYYVSARQAAQILSPMVRGNFERVDMMLPNRRRMYYSLLEKVIELSEKRMFVNRSLLSIVQHAVISPAPEFFVGHETLHHVRKCLKNGYYDNEGRTVGYKSHAVAYAKLKKKREELRAYRQKMTDEEVRKSTPSEDGNHRDEGRS